jgi:hypothetical protein
MSGKPLSVDDVLKKHAAAERACYEQARREVNGQAHSGVEWIRLVLQRAQEIKRGSNGKA